MWSSCVSNNSDYKKSRLKLDEMLPSVYGSDINKSIFENVFNRFFTKEETQVVSGYVGQSDAKYVKSRQIVEPTLHRQTSQLQPVLHHKLGTEDKLLAWKDILNKLEQQGVDIERLPIWGSVQQFNWVPPVDIDKIINYRNYYWVDSENSNSTPQYFTIRSRCATATANLNHWNKIINEHGSTFLLVDIKSSTDTVGQNNQFIIDGNYDSLFGEGFPLYVSGSTNNDINEQTFFVQQSLFFNGQTIITIDTTFVDDTVSGSIDLNFRQALLQSTKDCQCSGSMGWDTANWDDNPDNPIWEGDFDILLNAITDPVDLTPLETTYGLWFDTSTDRLYQFNGIDWSSVVYENFSDVLSNMNGQAFWDMSPNCGIQSVVSVANQWIDQNKWVHKTDVTNFAIAKQAKLPIIEFEWDLELNEWTYTKHKWKYRINSSYSWEDTEDEPSICEIVPLEFPVVNLLDNEIIFDPKYGDMTDFFTPGVKFHADGVNSTFEVLYSIYKSDTIGALYKTRIFVTDASTIAGTLFIYPNVTSKGDPWKGYSSNSQWLYVGAENPVPIPHQPINLFSHPIDNLTPYNYNVEEYTITPADILLPYVSITFTYGQIALAGFNDIRVYKNGELQEGNFQEVGTPFVTGITFNPGTFFNVHDIIRIVIGPESINDLGRESVLARVDSNDNTFVSASVPISLIRYRKIPQVKSNINQQPLFDIYTVESDPKFQANPIFSFKENDSYPVDTNINMRIEKNSITSDYTFEQFLLDDSKLLAYRDYERRTSTYWFNTRTQVLHVWDEICWSTKQYIDTYYISPIVSPIQPLSPWSEISGLLWVDTTSNTLKECSYVFPNTTWNIVTDVIISDTDPTLTSVWKGNTDYPYIPKKVDWKGRSLQQYEDEQSSFVESTIAKLFIENPSLSLGELTDLANEQWYNSQINTHSPTGIWVGDWEIPFPLYYNNQHENRSSVSLRELLTHFRSIINSQDLVAGYSGVDSSMFRLIPSNDVNYGVGGTIKEFNSSFDNFLSSLFIEYPSIFDVITFARNQYDSLTNQFNERFKQTLVDVITQNISTPHLEVVMKDKLILEHETNLFLSQIYSDSTVTELKNWIITLPFLNLNRKQPPVYVNDPKINTNFLIHHDGHFDSYIIPPNTTESLKQQIVRIFDNRDNQPLGIAQPNDPPTNITDFLTAYGTSIENKNGAFWYNNVSKILYRLEFVHVGSNLPPITSIIGDKWYNTLDLTVYVLTDSGWVAPNIPSVLYTIGQDFSAWSVFDLSTLCAYTISDIETKLFNSVPTSFDTSYDIEQVKADNLLLWNEIERQYFDQFVIENGIVAPFLNDDYDITNPFTWNYKQSVPSLYPTVGSFDTGGTWQDLYTKLYNTPVPHIEPWKLQGYVYQPNWWNDQYKSTDQINVRRWNSTMWANILGGVIPVGTTYPNGAVAITGNPITEPSNIGAPSIPIYNYVSVNISSTDVTMGAITFCPDDLFPPYLNYTSLVPFLGSTIRSVFDNISQIVAPSNNYDYGDKGLVEYNWKQSLNYKYCTLMIAYRIDPINFFYGTFGTKYVKVGDLDCSLSTHAPISHRDIMFHGDLKTTTSIFQTNGTNQWYVNFCRYGSYDISSSRVAPLWKEWSAPLSYQMSTFIETENIEVSHQNASFSSLDYSFLVKKVPNVENFWLHTFDVSIIEFPPTFLKKTYQSDWRFEISTPVPKGLPIKFYGVHRHQFWVDSITNVCHINTFEISNVIGNNVYIGGDWTQIFGNTVSVEIFNSATNNNTYDIVSVEYDINLKQTVILLAGILDDLDDSGNIKALHLDIPWVTGDLLSLATDGIIFSPLNVDKQYFLIKVNNTSFKLALTLSDSLNNIPIILTNGSNHSYLCRRSGSFTIKNMTYNSDTWYTYEINKNIEYTISLPKQMYGVQNLVDFIIGYDVFTYDQGWRVNSTQEFRDILTNRAINWQYELEGFIDFIYYERQARFTKNQIAYGVIYDDLNGVFEFTDHYSQHVTGDPILFTSVNGPLPNNIESHVTYYMIRVSNSTFKVASNIRNARVGIEYTGVSTAIGQGTVSISTPTKKRQQIPHKTINPIKNGVWFKNSKGIVTNLVPDVDNFGKHYLFSQTGMPIKSKNVFVYRQDKLTNIQIQTSGSDEALAVANVSVDFYEHLMQFNNFTVGNDFVYDPFIGLNITKINLEFNRQFLDTQRPNVGGYVLNTSTNGQKQLTRNIEGNIDDLRYAYDHTINRNNVFTEKAQQTLGYIKETTSLDSLYISKKSQFEFWKGMIQHKGSLNSIKAFVNSKRFIDAKVDEFWAIKIAEYGSSGEKEYPEMKLFVDDSRTNDIRLHFTQPTGIAATGFQKISIDNSDRWYNQPDQQALLLNNDNQISFELVPATNQQFEVMNGQTFIEHNMQSACIVGTLEITQAESTHAGGTSSITISTYIPNSGMLSVFDNGVLISDYAETNNTTITKTSGTFIGPVVVIYRNAFLTDYHLMPINSNIVLLNSDVQSYITSPVYITLWDMIVDNKTNIPFSVIDNKSHAKVSNVISWNPLKSQYYGQTISSIDIISKDDPARYTETLALNTDNSSFSYDWTGEQVGTTWFDTNNVGYLPYNDVNIYPSLDDQIQNWGILSDWASHDVYEWVKSDVHPEEWNDLAASEVGDLTIPESIRKSGQVHKTLFRKVGLDWIVMTPSVKIYNAYINTTIDLSQMISVFDDETINVYINGKFIHSLTYSSGTPLLDVLSIYPQLDVVDIITTVRPIPTDEDIIENMVNTGNYSYDYQYSTNQHINDFDTLVTTYYFWVKTKTTKTKHSISIKQTSDDLNKCPVPFVFSVDCYEKNKQMVSDKIVICGLQGIVGDNDRYILRITHDSTLRDSLNRTDDINNIKHEEWKMFREEQLYNIDRWMWDKITESMIGYKITNPLIRVPSYERELYDVQYDSETRFGLEDGQSFVDGNIAKETIQYYLEDSNNDFYPLDIGAFLDAYNMSTPENIISLMDTIYNSFSYVHVNKIYFSVLHDAISCKRKYPGLFKTSMVALHGVKPFQVGGVFDD